MSGCRRHCWQGGTCADWRNLHRLLPDERELRHLLPDPDANGAASPHLLGGCRIRGADVRKLVGLCNMVDRKLRSADPHDEGMVAATAGISD